MPETRPQERHDAARVPRSIGRVLDLLEIVLAEGSCNLTTAATQSSLTPTTARRHLRALEARGYIHRDDSGHYAAGPTLVRLAAAVYETSPLERLVATARPYLEELAGVTGESTYLVVSDGRVATYVATAESDRAIRHVGWVGQNVALKGTAVGEALANPGTCAAQTGAIEPDITAVSLALGDCDDLRVALSVVGPKHRLGPKTRRRIERALAKATLGLSRDLGVSQAAVAS